MTTTEPRPIVDVAVGVCAYLIRGTGGDWTVRDHPYDRCSTIAVDGGYSLTLEAEWTGKKIEIRPDTPEGMTHGDIGTRPKIGVGRTRNPAGIAGDIVSRLLPQLEPWLLEAEKRQAERLEYEADIEATRQRLLEAGCQNDTHGDGVHCRHTGAVQIARGGVHFGHMSATVDQAVAIINILKGA